MKILFITTLYEPYIGGGAEISNKILAEGLIKKKINIEVITSGKEEKIEEISGVKIRRIFFNKILKKYLNIIEKKGKISLLNKIEILVYRFTLYFNIFHKEKIEKLILEIKPDVLHTSGIHLFFPQLWWKIAKKHNIKVIHTLRDPLFLYFRGKNTGKFYFILDKFQRKYYNFYLNKYVNVVHSPSKFMIEKHIKNGVNIKSGEVIYNTIKDEVKKDIFFNIKEIEILYVGSLDYNKGIKTLIELKKNNPSLKIVCVGDGRLKEECIRNSIVVTGWIKKKEVYSYIKNSKILVLPSEWEEAFGRVLIEGVINGTLVIGSDQGAIPEVLGYKNEYIFKAKNIPEFNKKIKRILNLTSEEYEAELKDMQNYMEKYNYENHIKSFIKLYKNLIKEE